MSFVSLPFFVLVTITIILYFLFPIKHRWYVLLAASGVFYYLSTGIAASLVILFTAVIVYYSAIWIENNTEKGRKKRFVFSIVIVVVVSVLILTKLKKYIDFLSSLIIPMGISYYTFSLIGYLADVYTGKQCAERNILKYLLYVLYFPKIIQGPISKYRIIGPKLVEGHPFSYQNLCMGIQLIIWGYFKKLVIAERTRYFDSLFLNLKDFDLGGLSLLTAAVLFGFGFYCDVSGYMDIVTGISQIMGINLDKNFDRPFFSRSSVELWRRWHITLGIWLRDYIYIPLGGSRKGKFRKYLNTFIIFLVSGIWHGTGIDFIIWGCYWGVVIILAEILDPVFTKIKKILHINENTADWHVFQTVRTFSSLLITGILAVGCGFRNTKLFFKIIFKDFGIGRLDIYSFTRYGLSGVNFVILVISILVLWMVEKKEAEGSVREFIAKLNPLAKWVVYALGVIIVLFFGIYGSGYSTSGFAYAFF